jgi:hypothetical protein
MTLVEMDWFVEVTFSPHPADVAKELSRYFQFLRCECDGLYGTFYAFVTATNMRQAANISIDRASIILRNCGLEQTKLVDLRVVYGPTHLALAAWPRIPDIVGMAEIQDILCINSRQQVWQLSQRPNFPQPVARLKAGKIYLRSQIVAFGKQWRRK